MLVFMYYLTYDLPCCSLLCKTFHSLVLSLASSLVDVDIILRATFIIFHFKLHLKSFLKCKQLNTVSPKTIKASAVCLLSLCSSCDLLPRLFKMYMLSLVINISWRVAEVGGSDTSHPCVFSLVCFVFIQSLRETSDSFYLH